MIVGSVQINFLSYRYIVDKSTISFLYEGPLGPKYQFWKESHVDIFIGRL